MEQQHRRTANVDPADLDSEMKASGESNSLEPSADKPGSDPGSDQPGSGKPERNYRRYGIILVAIFAIRFLEVAVSELRLRQSISESSFAWACILLSPVLICPFVVKLCRRHFPSLVTILLSALAGGTLTLLVSSIPGMMIGAIIGLLLAFDLSRRWTRVAVVFSARAVLPAMMLGLLAGFLGSMTLVTRRPSLDANRVGIWVCVLIAVASFVWSCLLARYSKSNEKLVIFLPAFLLSFIAAAICFSLGTQLDIWRRLSAIESRVHVASEWVWPLSFANLTQGFTVPTYLNVSEGISLADAEYLNGFGNFWSVYIDRSGESPNYDGLDALDLSGTSFLYTFGFQNEERSGFDDKAFSAFAKSSGLQHLMLHNTSITDRGLAVLKNMPSLSNIDLSWNEIDGSGLQYLRGRGAGPGLVTAAIPVLPVAGQPGNPAAPIQHLNLTRTKTDDLALSHLAQVGVAELNLSDTNITGSGLKQLNLPMLAKLQLDRTPLKETFLADLSAATSLRHLSLIDVPITSLGIESLARATSTGSMMWLSELDITGSRVDDSAIKQLKQLNLQRLSIDATKLSEAAMDSIAHIVQVELVFDADADFNSAADTHAEAAAASLDEIILRGSKLRERLRTLRSALRVAAPANGDPITIAIRNLVIQPSMLAELRKLESCVLLNARIRSRESRPEGRLEPYDLSRFFPDAFTAEENTDDLE